jgi:hypothetical protein
MGSWVRVPADGCKKKLLLQGIFLSGQAGLCFPSSHFYDPKEITQARSTAEAAQQAI